MEGSNEGANQQKINCSMVISTSAPKVVRRQYHSAALTTLDNMPKEHIFIKVYSLINRLIQNPIQLIRILTQLQFYDPKQPQKENVAPAAHKKVQPTKFARISINCTEELSLNKTDTSIESSGSLFSAETILTFNQLSLPCCHLSLQLVESIYEIPVAFLIALSICLLLKYTGKSGVALTSESACWMMSISTIVAYKFYYDEPVGGLVDSFSYILDVNRETIIDLERCMLQGIDYQIIITNSQYHQVLCLLTAQDK